MTRRVLFVDDEQRVLEGIENLMFVHGEQWDVFTAESGPAALEVLARGDFDIIVSDMQMPEMDGAQLLDCVRDNHPSVLRAVLTGHSELEATKRAMSNAHRFLTKPCSPTDLVGALENACHLNELLEDSSIRDSVVRLDTLPARPTTFTEIQRLLASDDWAFPDVVAIIESDAAVATRIVQVANTAYFSRGAQVTSVQNAVSRIGARLVAELVLAFQLFGAFSELSGVDTTEFHQRGLASGRLARQFLDGPSRDEAYLAGLVQDVGKLVFAVQLPNYSTDMAGAPDDQPDYRTEEALYGTSHAEVGAFHLGVWGLPPTLVNAVANHHHPERSEGFDLAAALYVANKFIDASRGGVQPTWDDEFIETIGIGDRLPELSRIAETTLAEVSE